jgi:isocitrate dehydrogenase
VKLQSGEVIDAAVMNIKSLRKFFREQIDDAKKNDILLSLHLKATMMKISDPIMFGHCVKEYFASAFEKHAATFEGLGVNPNNGIGDAFDKIKSLPDIERASIESDLLKCIEDGPRLAMVDSNRGITNLHVPSDVIIDASMPVVVRDSGMMWNKDNALEECKAMIPDRSYAGVYKQVLDFCRQHGQFDVSTMVHHYLSSSS